MKKLLFILLLPCLAYAQTNTTPQFKRNVPADSLLGYSIPGITGNHWLPDTAWVKHHVSGGGGTTTNPLTLTYGFTGQPLSFNGSAGITGKIDTTASTGLRTGLNSLSLAQLQTKFNLYTLTSRQIINGYGITGGHNFVTDITLAADSSLLQTVLNFFPKGDTRYYTKTLSDGKYALQATTLTINGTAFDLSTNRSWTVSGFTPVSPFTDITSDGSGNPVSSAQILHQPVKYATAAALPANTYSNGTSGVGATITANANGALTVDGSTPSVNDRILVWQEAVQTKNGIYLVTQVGDGSHPFILTRGSYSSIAGNMIAGSQVYAQLGTAYAQNTFTQTTTGTITFGTTNLVYTSSTLNFLTGYFSGAGTQSSPLFPNYDATPTNGSIYGVQSGGVYTALAGKQTTVTLTTSGTTGASTFNPSTGALNIPVYAGTSYTNGYGINLSGSTFSADTTSSTALVSKGRLATNLAGYVKQTTTVAGFALSSNVTLANLSATDATLTFSGAYTGATARTVGINLGNANTWGAKQTFSVAPNLTGSSTTNYVWTATDNAGNGSWQASSGGGGVSIIGTAGGSIANGASISGSTLTLGFGDGTNPGIVSTGTQTFGGIKTLTTPVFSGLPTGSGVAFAATASTLLSRDANGNGTLNALLQSGQSIATAAGTTTLTVSSPYETDFTGSTTQTIALPVVSTLVLFQKFLIVNLSSGIISIQTSGGNLLQTMASGSYGVFTCILTTGTGVASWSVQYVPSSSGTFMDLTTNQTAGGNKTFTGNVTFNNSGNFTSNGISTIVTLGGSATNASTLSYNSNVDVQANVSSSWLQFGGSSNVSVRLAAEGGLSAVGLGTNNNFGDFIIGSSPTQTSTASGTHAWLSNLVINKLGTVTVTTGTVTNTSSVYINGQSTAGTNNYNLISYSPGVSTTNIWAKYGTTRVSALKIDSLLTGTIGTDAIIVGHSGVLGTIGANSLVQSPNGSISILASSGATLSSGTVTVTVTGATSGSHGHVTYSSPSGTTLTTGYQITCTTNSCTIQADVAAGTINTADNSTINYLVTN